MFSSGSLHEAFEIFTEHGREFAESGVSRLVIRDPVTVRPEDHVLRAAATMVSRQIRRLPVVEEGHLVGTISRADVALAVLYQG